MKRSLQLFSLLLLLIFSASSVLGLEIKVEGASRTNHRYLIQIVRNCMSSESTGSLGSLQKVEQCVMNSKLFSKVRLSRDKMGLRIWVDEKWTLLVLPQIEIGDGGKKKYGLYVIETNFLGLGKMLVVGGSTSADSDGYVVYYKDRSLGFSPFGFSVVASSIDSNYELEKNGSVLDAFKEKKVGGMIAGGYANQKLDLSLGYGVSDQTSETLSDLPAPTDRNIEYVFFSGVWNDTNYKLFFEDGVKFQTKILTQIGRSDGLRKATKTEYFANYEKGDVGLGAFKVGARFGVVEKGDKADSIRIGQTKGTRGIGSRAAWADRYVNLSFDYNYPLIQKNYGTWVSGPFFDRGAVYAQGYPHGMAQYQSYGFGLYLFLNEIALPGVGVEYGTSDSYKKTFMSISIGVGL